MLIKKPLLCSKFQEEVFEGKFINKLKGLQLDPSLVILENNYRCVFVQNWPRKIWPKEIQANQKSNNNNDTFLEWADGQYSFYLQNLQTAFWFNKKNGLFWAEFLNLGKYHKSFVLFQLIRENIFCWVKASKFRQWFCRSGLEYELVSNQSNGKNHLNLILLEPSSGLNIKLIRNHPRYQKLQRP
jgi:hypothetical protein